MDNSVEETQATPATPRPDRTQTIIYLICQLITIGSFAGLLFTQNRTIDSNQETIDNYKELVSAYEEHIDLKDRLLSQQESLLSQKDSLIDFQRETIINYELIVHKYERIIDDNIKTLKKANHNAEILLANAHQQ